jgi:hypothetical protein
MSSLTLATVSVTAFDEPPPREPDRIDFGPEPATLDREAAAVVMAAALSLGSWGRLISGTATDRDRREILRALADRSTASAARFGRLLSPGLGVADAAAVFAAFARWLRVRHRAASLTTVGDPDPRSSTLTLAPADATEADRQSREHLALLARWRIQDKAGESPRDGRTITRARLYGAALWSIGMAVQRARVIRTREVARPGRASVGALAFERDVNRRLPFYVPRVRVTQERRVLGPADHCPECPGLASTGWQPLGLLPDIGDTVCRAHCACHFEYR